MRAIRRRWRSADDAEWIHTLAHHRSLTRTFSPPTSLPSPVLSRSLLLHPPARVCLSHALPASSLPAGESGLVASGISSYELCRRSLGPVARHASCQGDGGEEGRLSGEGEGQVGREVGREGRIGGRGGGEGLCSQCREEGRMVERSVTTAVGCAVRGCGEEGLWACESALLLWDDCQVSVACVRGVCARTCFHACVHM